MLNRLLTIIALTLLSATTVAVAQDSPVLNAPVDTVYNPNILYTGMPKSYEIAGIEVTGVPNYEDYIIIGYSGLNVGDRVEIPGPDITNAAKRFARQGRFSTIKFKVAKMNLRHKLLRSKQGREERP